MDNLRIELRLRDEKIELLPDLSRRDVAVVHRRGERLETAARDEDDIVTDRQSRLTPYRVRLSRHAVDCPRSNLRVACQLIDHAVVLDDHEVSCKWRHRDDIAAIAIADIHPLTFRDIVVVLRPVRAIPCRRVCDAVRPTHRDTKTREPLENHVARRPVEYRRERVVRIVVELELPTRCNPDDILEFRADRLLFARERADLIKVSAVTADMIDPAVCVEREECVAVIVVVDREDFCFSTAEH